MLVTVPPAGFTVHAPPPLYLVTTRNILAPTVCEWLGDVYMKCYVLQGRMYQELDGCRAITVFAEHRHFTNEPYL